MVEISKMSVSVDEENQIYEVKVGNLTLTIWAHHDVIHVIMPSDKKISAKRMIKKHMNQIWINP